jgi:hypothetical protein
MTLIIHNMGTKNGAKDLLMSTNGAVENNQALTVAVVITKNGRIGQQMLTQTNPVNTIMEEGLSSCPGTTTMDPFRKSLSEALLTVTCTFWRIQTK